MLIFYFFIYNIFGIDGYNRALMVPYNTSIPLSIFRTPKIAIKCNINTNNKTLKNKKLPIKY